MKSNKMKAIVQTRYGLPGVLQLKVLGKPAPKDNEVLIRVNATTATAADGSMRKGSPFIGRFYTGLTKPKRAIPGVEFAGEIESVGKDVKLFKEGDLVFGETTALGCYAGYVCVPEAGVLTTKPDNITCEEAAPVCGGALTALNFLRRGNIRSGQTVLIYGASGSIGTYAAQLARYFGAEVTGVCSTTNVEMVKSLGAHKVIDYTQEDFTKSGRTYNIIFDTVGKSSFSRCKGLLTRNGVYLSTVLDLPLFFQMLWTSMTGGKNAKFSATGMLPVRERLILLKELKEIFKAGQIKSVIDKRYPLEQMAEAHHYVEQGHKKGNVVITVSAAANSGT
jgi:NADPH:quinone reductase-like Zn-dependent oxidoreductase